MKASQLPAQLKANPNVASIIEHKCTLADNGRGMIINTALEFTEWSTLLGQFAFWVDSFQWVLGDLIAYGELHYDRNKYKLVMERTDRKYKTVHKWGLVASKFSPDERTYNLSFTHYSEAADVARSERASLLSRAANEGWAVLRLRTEVENLARTIDTDAIVLGAIPTTSSVVIGQRFEDYIFALLQARYPDHTWERLGSMKHNERGLDFLGRPFGATTDQSVIGVQAKCHAPNQTPSDEEWLKFLAGCFTRRVTKALFITTGRLTSHQYREAGESGLGTVVAGAAELNRLAKKLELEPFN